ncbi:MAG: hypothetical protein ACT4TC_24975 [Myxococcaceae bacterium]
MRYLIEHERLTVDVVRSAIARALVPEILVETFRQSRLRVDDWLAKL